MSHGLTFSLGAIILAAGKSSRMGSPKMLLPWGNTSILGHQVKLWSQLPADQVVVVYAAGNLGIERELNRLNFPARNRIVNPDAERGMFSSIQCAAQWHGWQPTITHWAIALGDQPLLRPVTLQSLAEFAQQHAEGICQPSRSGHARHPVLLSATNFKHLAKSGVGTLKEFLHEAQAVKLLEIDDPGLEMDLDEPSDYQAALKLLHDS